MEVEVSTSIVLNVNGEPLRLTPDFRISGLRIYLPYLCQDSAFCITEKSLSKVKWCDYKNKGICGPNISFDEAMGNFVTQRYTRDGLEIEEDVIPGFIEIRRIDPDMNERISGVPALFVKSARTPRGDFKSAGSIGFLGGSWQKLWFRKYLLKHEENLSQLIFGQNLGTIEWTKDTESKRILRLSASYDTHLKTSSVDWSIPEIDNVLVTLNSVSTCEVNLFPFTTGHWTAVMDPGSLCLSLPPFLLKNLMSRLPLSCPGYLPGPVRLDDRFCKISSNVNVEDLPDILFLFEGDQEISISFSDLFIESTNDQFAFCLVEGIYRKRYESSTYNPPVIFGKHALKNIDFRMMSLGGRGFSTSFVSENPNRKPKFQSEYCKSSATCLSTQTYEEASNRCIDPTCDSLGWKLDEDTRSCEIIGSFLGISVFCIVFCYLLNILVSKYQRNRIKKNQ